MATEGNPGVASATSAALDNARAFLAAAYADKPEAALLSLVEKGKWSQPRLDTSAEATALAIAGTVDIYMSMAALTGPPPKGSRVQAELACWAPGIWVDLDVTGAPTNNGKLVTGGAPNQKVAVAKLRELIEPTVVWSSGWGVQALVVVPGGVVLDDSGTRDELSRLVQRFQQALRDHTGWKIDSTHDVVRVLRPPGSVNSKRPERLRPAHILEQTEPSFSLDELAARFAGVKLAEAPRPNVKPAHPPVVGGHDGVLERWKTHPQVERFATEPADDDSARDFAVACFAVEHGADHGEVGALVGAVRAVRCGDAKAGRPDYLSRTAAKAIATTKQPETAGALTAILGLEQVGLRVIGAEVFGLGSTASADLLLSDGSRVTFRSLADFGTPSRLGIEMAASAGVKIEPKRGDALKALTLLHSLAQVQGGAAEDDVARLDYGAMFLQDAQLTPVDMADKHERWRAFSDLKAATPVRDARELGGSIAAHTVVLVDKAGTRYVPAGTFFEFVRQSGWHISPAALKTQMARVGWKRTNARGSISARQPGGHGQISHNFYLVAAGWEDDE